jgi:cytochrome c peroxidase
LHERLAAVKQGEKVVPSVEKWEDIPNDAGFLYGIRHFVPTGGKGPKGFAFSPDGTIAVANYFTGELSVIDEKGKITGSFTFGLPLTATTSGLGNMYFHDATLCFQQWQSCASCHPNDARMDGLNWDLLNDGAGNPKNTKSLLYSHRTPPCMITGIRKNAETAGRSGLKFIHFADVPDEIAQAMDEYLKSLVPMASPYLVDGRLSKAAERGKINFDTYCASCHAGQYYTDMKQYRVGWATPRNDVPMDVPTLTEIWRTAPYLYDGRSYTMRELLDVHGPEAKLSSTDLDDLAIYVLSL